MGAVASFDFDKWVTRYPEFQELSRTLILEYFGEATVFHANDGSGPVADAEVQRKLLGMVTAHICKMNAPIKGAHDVVGRLSSVGEGSVSISVENDFPPGSAQWFQQTKYGASYWAATRPYRTMRYMGNPGRFNGFGSRW